MLRSHGLRAAAVKSVAAGPSVTYQTYVDSGTGAQTYTFNNVSIGGPGLIVVTVHAESNLSSSGTISSATIGGVSATLVQNVTFSSNSAQNTYAGIISAVITSGSTATIVINFGGGQNYNRCAIGVWRIQNYSSSTASVSTNAGTTTSASSSNLTLSSVPNNSVIVSGVTIGTNGLRVTWTNITERFDGDIASSLTGVSGGDATATSTGNYSITATYSGSSAQGTALVAAAWL